MISFSTQNRDHVYSLIASAIRRSIEYCRTNNTLTAPTKEEETKPDTKQEQPDVHEPDAADSSGLESQLKQAVVTTFGSARAAFDTYAKEGTVGTVGKKELKKLIKRVLPSLTPAETKRLRKVLPSRMSSVDFCAFIGGPEDTGSSAGNAKGKIPSKETEPSGLASLPPEVPEVCHRICCLVYSVTSAVACSCHLASELDCMPRSSC